MTDIGLVAEASQLRSVGIEHANVVQQSCLLDKFDIDSFCAFDMGRYAYCQFSNLETVCQKDLLCLLVANVIFVY